MLMPLDRTDTTGLLAFPMSNALIPLMWQLSQEVGQKTPACSMNILITFFSPEARLWAVRL